jgi:DNA-binding transcriptional LysR family regulator
MLQHLDTDLLRAFVMVAETKSFTKASERLYRTQAAISMQIKRLEERIGKQLFVRSGHGACLTNEGALLIHYARRMLHLNDEAFANLSVRRAEDVVRIGVPDHYATMLVSDVLLLFNKTFPEVQVEIVCDNRVDLVREARDGRIDLALVMCHPESKDGEVIRHEPLCWITSADNSPHDCDPLPLALSPSGSVCRDIALSALRETGRNCRVVITSGPMAAILAAVSASAAVSMVEESVIPVGVRRLGEADGFPSLGTVDVVLYRAPGHQRRTAAMLAEHIHMWLNGEGVAQRPERTATVRSHISPPLAVVATSPQTLASRQRDAQNTIGSKTFQSSEPLRLRSRSGVGHET